MSEDYATSQDHIDDILDRFESEFTYKYAAGQSQHGGKLWKKSTFRMMKDEALDFISYMYVLEDHLLKLRELARLAIETGDLEYCNKILNILEVGNEEGIPEEDK